MKKQMNKQKTIVPVSETIRLRPQGDGQWVPNPDGAKEYHPHLAQWRWEAVKGKPNELALMETDDDGKRVRTIATIIVNPVFSLESVERIGDFIEHGPQLWQELRELSRFTVVDAECYAVNGKIWSLLWYAAGDDPFDTPDPNGDDRIHRDLMTLDRTGKLPEKAVSDENE